MRIILLGPPGSGKGTQAQFIVKKYNIPHISTGNILRKVVETQSKLGKEVQTLINDGHLVNNELVIALVKERIKQNDCYNGFLLDGFPRNLQQALAIRKEGIEIDYVLEFMVPEHLSIDRIVGRQVHLPSGRIYHTKFNPPKKVNKDDLTDEALIIREDDREEVVIKRLMEYRQQTVPLIDYFRKKARIGHIKYFILNSSRSVEEIRTEILYILQ